MSINLLLTPLQLEGSVQISRVLVKRWQRKQETVEENFDGPSFFCLHSDVLFIRQKAFGDGFSGIFLDPDSFFHDLGSSIASSCGTLTIRGKFRGLSGEPVGPGSRSGSPKMRECPKLWELTKFYDKTKLLYCSQDTDQANK